MAGRWLTCPHCQIYFFQPDDQRLPAQCSACGKSLSARADEPEVRWYYPENRKKAGPVGIGRLRELVAAGQLQRSDMVLQEGAARWAEASTVEGLFPAVTAGTDLLTPLAERAAWAVSSLAARFAAAFTPGPGERAPGEPPPGERAPGERAPGEPPGSSRPSDADSPELPPGLPGWYVIGNKQKVGPLAWSRLRELVAAGQLRPTDMVLPRDSSRWAPAATLEGLFPEGESAAPTQPAPAVAAGSPPTSPTPAAAPSADFFQDVVIPPPAAPAGPEGVREAVPWSEPAVTRDTEPAAPARAEASAAGNAASPGATSEAAPIAETPPTAVPPTTATTEEPAVASAKEPASPGAQAAALLKLSDQEIVRRFESAWLQGKRPELGDYLPAHPEQRAAVLPKMAQIDLRCRLNCKEPVRVETYLERFPELTGNSQVLQLIEVEALVRRIGWSPQGQDELLERFPSYREELQARYSRAVKPEDRRQEAKGEDREAEAVPARPSLTPEPALVPLAAPTIPGFKVLEVIGRGGMGPVYKARDVRRQRLVALKMLPAGAQPSPQQREHFLNLARASTRLSGPNIVQFYEVGEARAEGANPPVPFIAMEYVEGGSLADRLEGRPFPPQAAAELVATLADAVHYAHGQGVEHRNLKPANILLGKGGVPAAAQESAAGSQESEKQRGGSSLTPDASLLTAVPKLTDFSVGRQPAAGGASYLAPELAWGHIYEVGPATDIYALGAILYELLTGRPPFRGVSEADTLDQVRRQDPVPPSRLVSRVPRALDTICLKCLAKAPARRYASAAALAQDLRCLLASRPIRARAPNLVARTVKFARREPRIAALAGAALVSALCGLLVLNDKLGDARAERNRATQQARQAQQRFQEAQEQAAKAAKDKHGADEALKTALAGEKAALENAKQAREAEKKLRDQNQSTPRRLYAAQLNLAQRAWEAGQLGLVLELLDRQRPERAGGVDRRDFEWNHLWRSCRLELLSLTKHNGPVRGVAFSRDGRQLASASADRTVRIWDATTGEELRVLKGPAEGVKCIAYAPDSRILASGSDDGSVQIWDANSGESLRTVRGPGSINGLAFSPDGRFLAGATDSQVVSIWNTATGAEVRTLKGHTDNVADLAYSPDGQQLASASEDRTVKLWNAVTGEELHTLHLVSPALAVAFGPDGRRLAAGAADRTVSTWDAPSGEFRGSQRWHSGPVVSLAYSPDGRSLASGSGDGTVKVLDAVTGAELHTLRGHTNGVAAVAYSPDGRRLASAGPDGAIKLWDAAWADEPLVLKAPSDTVAYSPDGTSIASANWQGLIRISDAVSGQQRRVLGKTNEMIRCLAFSPNGQQLVSAGDSIVIWNIADGLERPLKAKNAGAQSIAFSPDGRHLASAHVGGDVVIRQTASGQPLHTLRAHGFMANAVAYHPDGRRLASAGNDGVKIWDPIKGEKLQALEGHTAAVLAIAFSAAGRYLASAGEDGTIKIWEAAAGKELRTLKGHTAAVRSIAFTAGGNRLFSGSQDQTVKLWDGETGDELATFKGHTEWVSAVAASPDGRRLVSASFDGTLRLYNGSDYLPAEQAARRAAVHDSLPGWYRALAQECEKKKQWWAAAFHLGKLIDLDPKDEKLLVRRADAHRQAENWLAAAADYSRAQKLKADLPVKDARDGCLSRSWPARAASVVGLGLDGPLPLLPGLAPLPDPPAPPTPAPALK